MLNSAYDGILYLSRDNVETICQEIDSVAVIRDVFRMHGSGQTVLPDEAYLTWRNEHDESVRSLNMPGYLGGELQAAGTKIINSNIANPTRGLPRASGITVLYDTNSARVMCIMEGAYISSLRTASVTALAMDLLRPAHMECFALIGSGVLAQMHVKLLVERFPDLRAVRLYDIDPGRVEAFSAACQPFLYEHDVALHVASTAEDAIRPAQIIVPATTTIEGYIRYAWLQPGALLVNISLDDPLPEVVFKATSVIIDDWNLVSEDPRRLIGRMFRQKQVVGPGESVDLQAGQRRIDAELGDIVTGAKMGRRQEGDIILVNPFGLAIEDVALASHVYRVAVQRHLGTWLPR
ncbi:ornithine cyclodeaminase [Ktedonobacteria bacterium brp13]|nr:ornithine cyclodeaminase [Ktedonobacteria bacterium brp13]